MKTIHCIVTLTAFALSAPAFSQHLTASGIQQISALMKEKESRSDVQRKIDSHLYYAAKLAAGLQIAPGIKDLPGARSAVQADAQGRALVDISATVGPQLLASLDQLGAQTVSTDASAQRVLANVPLSKMEAVAGLSAVQHLGLPPQPITHGAIARGRTAHLLSNLGLRPDLGVSASVLPGHHVSQGDRAHMADVARSHFKIDGTGVKIGVISDGVDSLAAAQAVAEIGNVTIIPGQAGDGDEGTAMLEIITDLAYGAQMFFATAGTKKHPFGEEGMAQNILALRAAGCDIIVDDAGYLSEAPFQDGPIARAVNAVVASGALYFTAAGNGGNPVNNTAGAWEGDFQPGLAIPALTGTGFVNSFFGTDGDIVQAVSQPGKNGRDLMTLKWADPLGASNNDYDLYILNSAMDTVIDAGNNFQTGRQDALEWGRAGIGEVAVVVLYRGQTRALRLDSNEGLLQFAAGGQSFGHYAAENAFSIAAINVAAAAGTVFTASTGNHVEPFSSAGPRTMFFNPDGTPITPGNFTFGTNGGRAFQKPDFTAADGVITAVAGFESFFGTSAAAPHAAGIAALMKSANPSLTRSQIAQVLAATALDIETPGVDTMSGKGIMMAYTAVQDVVGAEMISPAPQSHLSGPAATFQWNSVPLASQYWLSAGTTPGGADLFNSGPINATSATINALPLNGAPIYVRLWTNINGSWATRDYQYAAANYPYAQMISPAPGSTLSSPVTFQWTSVPGVRYYSLSIGPAPGTADYYAKTVQTTSLPVSNEIPTGRVPLFVTLSTLVNGVWQSIDYVYTSR